MNAFITLLTAITFYFIGRYSHSDDSETIHSTTKAIKSRLKPIRMSTPQAAIEYKTPQQLEYEESEQAKVDKEWERMLKT